MIRCQLNCGGHDQQLSVVSVDFKYAHPTLLCLVVIIRRLRKAIALFNLK
jgi:hypothetical protein